MDRRQDEAHLFSELPAQALDAVEERAGLSGIHQPDEAVPDLDFHEIQRGHLRGGFFGLGLRGRLCRRGLRRLLLFIHLVGHPGCQPTQCQEGHVRKTGNQAQRQKNPRRRADGFR